MRRLPTGQEPNGGSIQRRAVKIGRTGSLPRGDDGGCHWRKETVEQLFRVQDPEGETKVQLIQADKPAPWVPGGGVAHESSPNPLSPWAFPPWKRTRIYRTSPGRLWHLPAPDRPGCTYHQGSPAVFPKAAGDGKVGSGPGRITLNLCLPKSGWKASSPRYCEPWPRLD